MKKRIFSLLLVCLILALNVMPCMAQEEVINVKNVSYDNGILTFTIANTTKTDISNSAIVIYSL